MHRETTFRDRENTNKHVPIEMLLINNIVKTVCKVLSITESFNLTSTDWLNPMKINDKKLNSK